MIAEKDLNVGDIALEIPVSIIISEELVLETEMVCSLFQKEKVFYLK
jgi:hypothetical protein